MAFCLAVITCYYHHFTFLTRPNDIAVLKDHFDVISGKALAPTQYRFAPYFIAQWLLNLAVLLGAANTSVNLLRVYLVIHVVVTAFSYFLLVVFLMRWFDWTKAILGLCFFVAVNPLAEYQYFHQPGDSWNLMFFLLGYLALEAGRDMWLFPLLFLGTPFRESIGLLVIAYAALRWGEMRAGRVIAWTVSLLVAFLVPWLAIRLHFGVLENYVRTHPGWENINFLHFNLTHPDGWVVPLLYFNVLWPALFLKWKKLPRFIRRTLVVAPLLFLSVLLWGRLIEGRLYLPLMPLFLPAGLLCLEERERDLSV